MSTKVDFNSLYASEKIRYDGLSYKESPLTTTGNLSFTSASSGLSYSSTTGENGLVILFQTLFASCNITASEFNAKAENVDLVAHLADNTKAIPHLGTTTNIGNAYSITSTETIVANQKFTVKINANSTGVATLNISSIGSTKGIKKAGGLDATLKIGVYTFFYDGTNFQLLGEGGDYGTAISSDVVLGKTIGTDNGIVTGTKNLSNLIASNIKNSINIDGIIGNVVEKKTITKTTTITVPTGSGSTSVGFTVSGVGFQPSQIFINTTNRYYLYTTDYSLNGGYLSPNKDLVYYYTTISWTISITNFVANSDGFTATFNISCSNGGNTVPSNTINLSILCIS